MDRISQLAKALIDYADKNGSFPRDLHTVGTSQWNVQPSVIVDPLAPEDGHYSYHAWTKDERSKMDARNTPLVWGRTHSGNGAIVAYLDGHVEKVDKFDDVSEKSSH